jgi:multidrug resistance protein MdtO
VSASALLDFLRRELAPTPGRLGAVLRITLASLITITLVLMFRMPNGLIAFVVIYMIALEDTGATFLGSIMGWIFLTLGLGTALLSLQVSIDTAWLRICFFAGYLFVGLFLRRALTVAAIGSVFGIPAAIALIMPDILPPNADVVLDFLLWLWWCGTLGIAINLGVQLLLSPGSPLSLLRRELDMRLQAVEHALRRRAGETSADPPSTSLDTLSVAGTTRPAAFVKTASFVDSWARARHESLAALVTLADRLVTAALTLEALPARAVTPDEGSRLLKAAAGCRQLRQGLQRWQRPSPAEWAALSPEPASAQGSPLADVERTLDDIALAVPGAGALHAHRPGFFVPDAFENRDYIRFATKGTLAALICYLAFVGFDYPEIYTCVITVFVVSLSTVGASNQKAVLRFGGAAAGGLLGVVTLVYVLPNVDSIGGFLLVFGAGCAIAAWVNVGSPRISYGGYQVGVAFWKATLQGFGVAVSAQVLRDRMVGIAFGLIVFGLVEHYLWPERASEALRARLSEALRLLAELARAATNGAAQATSTDLDSWRLRISLKVAEVQALIESTKFERQELDVAALAKKTADAQIVFVLLLTLARRRRDPGLPDVIRVQAREIDSAVAKTLETLAARAAGDITAAAGDLHDALTALERSVSGGAPAYAGASITDNPSLGLYRSLVAALRRLSPEPLASAPAS